jgi:FMN-dependent NADH-azoreductase
MKHKLVVIDGHPDLESLGHSAALKLKVSGESLGFEVTVLRAYEYPFLTQDPARNSFPPEFESAIKAIEAAEYLAFVSPMWNLSMTGGLKNFIDGVMQPQRLFEYTAKGPKGLLNTKKALIIWTSGGPALIYKFVFGNPVYKQIKAVFKFCGVKKFSQISLGGIHGKDSEAEKAKIETFLNKITDYKF